MNSGAEALHPDASRMSCNHVAHHADGGGMPLCLFLPCFSAPPAVSAAAARPRSAEPLGTGPAACPLFGPRALQPAWGATESRHSFPLAPPPATGHWTPASEPRAPLAPSPEPGTALSSAPPALSIVSPPPSPPVPGTPGSPGGPEERGGGGGRGMKPLEKFLNLWIAISVLFHFFYGVFTLVIKPNSAQ